MGAKASLQNPGNTARGRLKLRKWSSGMRFSKRTRVMVGRRRHKIIRLQHSDRSFQSSISVFSHLFPSLRFILCVSRVTSGSNGKPAASLGLCPPPGSSSIFLSTPISMKSEDKYILSLSASLVLSAHGPFVSNNFRIPVGLVGYGRRRIERPLARDYTG